MRVLIADDQEFIRRGVRAALDRDGFRVFQLKRIIENVSELVGRDVSAVIFLPEHLILRPDGYRVDIAGATYSRIPGMWVVSSTDSRMAMDLASSDAMSNLFPKGTSVVFVPSS
jgi:hypothetical protein